jgi:hypothetical protein
MADKSDQYIIMTYMEVMMIGCSSSIARLPLAAAMEARDVSAMRDAFAPDAVFHSPLTEALAFKGREQIGLLAEVLFEVFEDFRYTGGVVSGDIGFLVARARVGGQLIEIVDHFRLDSDKRVEEITVFFRPLPGAAAALRAIGAGLGRRKSRARGAVISGLTLPLTVMTRIGDRIGVGLIRASL